MEIKDEDMIKLLTNIDTIHNITELQQKEIDLLNQRIDKMNEVLVNIMEIMIKE